MKSILLLILSLVYAQDTKVLFEYMQQVQLVCGTDFSQCLHLDSQAQNLEMVTSQQEQRIQALQNRLHQLEDTYQSLSRVVDQPKERPQFKQVQPDKSSSLSAPMSAQEKDALIDRDASAIQDQLDLLS